MMIKITLKDSATYFELSRIAINGEIVDVDTAMAFMQMLGDDIFPVRVQEPKQYPNTETFVDTYHFEYEHIHEILKGVTLDNKYSLTDYKILKSLGIELVPKGK